jgi:RNA polymerase sigma-70 factor, ECF subfamily
MSDVSKGDNVIHPFKISREAFNDLFRTFYPGLRAYANLFAPSEAAEDIVQDVFVNIWEDKEVITIHTSLQAYLFRAVYTRCLNYIRRQKMLQVNHHHIGMEMRDEEASFLDPDKNEIIRRLYMNDLRDEINQAIDSLPLKCREVFTLSYMADMKNREISKLLDISVSTVEKHINHALKTLRQLLQNRHVLLFLTFFH